METLTSKEHTSNFSSPGYLQRPSWDFSDLISAVVLSLCFLLGVPGNIAVILLKPNWQNISSLSRSLMLNLAISDLLCLLTLPLWIYSILFGWRFELVACKVLAYFVYCSLYCSLLTVTGLSIQRYLVVVRQKRCHRVHVRVLLMMLWLAAAILSIPALVVRNVQINPEGISCQAYYSSESQWVAVLLTETVFGFISFTFVAFSYVCLRRKVDQAAFFNNPQTNRLLTSIIVSFFVLWAPYHTINVVGVAAICLKNEGLLNFCIQTWDIFGALTFVNSCLNPLLYAFTSRKMCVVCIRRKLLHQKVRYSQTEISTIAEHYY